MGIALPRDGQEGSPKVSHVQVCVIGAGIAGLTTAYSLAKEGLEVLVLEEREIGGGQTSKTTANLASALDDRFSELERSRGEEACKVAAASHGAAIDRIESIVTTEKIDCEFRPRGWLLVRCLAPGRQAHRPGTRSRPPRWYQGCETAR